MILSQTAIYALEAALYLAEHAPDTPVRFDDIANELDVPRNYLSKILHSLARGGVLISSRGPGGGFRLARPPSELKLSEVLRHFGNLHDASGCLLGRDECSDLDPCAAHDRWKSVSVAVKDFFSETSVADLSQPGSPLMIRDTG